MPRLTTPALLILAALLLVGCADSGDDTDQRILSPYDEDAGLTDVGDHLDDANDAGDGDTLPDTDDAGGQDGPDVHDPTPDDVGSGAADAGDGFCQPAGDNKIRRDRFPAITGSSAPFLIRLDAPVDTAGEPADDGRRWDLSSQGDDDFTAQVTLEDPGDHWFGDLFPHATYAAPLSQGEDDEMGIFQITDDALLMVGIASPEDGYFRTELEYDPPVTVLSFPLELDKSWSTETRVSGSFGGNHVHGHDEVYTTSVDQAGTLKTPYGTFDVLRVNTHLEQEVWMGGFVWVTTEVQTHTFVAECFGTVARITSPDDQVGTEFDEAREIMRLGL